MLTGKERITGLTPRVRILVNSYVSLMDKLKIELCFLFVFVESLGVHRQLLFLGRYLGRRYRVQMTGWGAPVLDKVRCDTNTLQSLPISTRVRHVPSTTSHEN